MNARNHHEQIFGPIIKLVPVYMVNVAPRGDWAEFLFGYPTVGTHPLPGLGIQKLPIA